MLSNNRVWLKGWIFNYFLLTRAFSSILKGTKTAPQPCKSFSDFIDQEISKEKLEENEKIIEENIPSSSKISPKTKIEYVESWISKHFPDFESSVRREIKLKRNHSETEDDLPKNQFEFENENYSDLETVSARNDNISEEDDSLENLKFMTFSTLNDSGIEETDTSNDFKSLLD